MYVHVCQGKNHVDVLKHFQVKDKAKRIKFKIKRGCQEIIRKQTQGKWEQSKEKNTPNPENKIIPQYGCQFYHEENHSMAWGKPQ